MLGIDIGKGFIKLVALRRHRRRWRLQARIACAVSAGDNGDVSALYYALQLLPLDMQRTLPKAGIALPVTELLVKTIELPPGLSHDQLEPVFSLEFEQLLMPDTEKICLDYRRCGRQTLAVACRHSLLEKSLAVLVSAGIEPALVGADALLIAGHPPSDMNSGELILYVDAGATGVRLHSLRAGVPVYVRGHVLPDICDDPAAYLLLLRRAIQQYRMSEMLSRPDAVVVHGGAATSAGVLELLQQSFGLPVECADPFSQWQIEDAESIKAGVDLPASAFMLACALARQEASCV